MNLNVKNCWAPWALTERNSSANILFLLNNFHSFQCRKKKNLHISRFLFLHSRILNWKVRFLSFFAGIVRMRNFCFFLYLSLNNEVSSRPTFLLYYDCLEIRLTCFALISIGSAAASTEGIYCSARRDEVWILCALKWKMSCKLSHSVSISAPLPTEG